MSSATKRPVESVLWQDYRSGNTGMLVFYASDPVSELPIREIPEELESTIQPEPHYESGTFGLYGCVNPKIRRAFVKGKHRYVFFLTKYAGTNENFRDKHVVTGYYRIFKSADTKKFHVRYLSDYLCLDDDDCMAVRANEVHFVQTADVFVVDEAALQAWNFTSKFTRQSRIILNEENTIKLVEYLKSKPNALKEYIDETKRLQPHDPDEEAEEEEESDEIQPKKAASVEAKSNETTAAKANPVQPDPQEPASAGEEPATPAAPAAEAQ
jgi:hypothetical protein